MYREMLVHVGELVGFYGIDSFDLILVETDGSRLIEYSVDQNEFRIERVDGMIEWKHLEADEKVRCYEK